MQRGTTPLHTFKMPVDASMIDKVRILYSQKDELVLVKNREDLASLEGNAATVILTQEETLKFNESFSVEIQVRILTTGDDALASRIKRVPVGKLLEDEVI